MNKSYDSLAAELGPISIETAKISAKLATASPEQMPALVDKLGSLETRKKDLLTTLAAMREAERQESQMQVEQAERKETLRKQQVFAKLKLRVEKHRVICRQP